VEPDIKHSRTPVPVADIIAPIHLDELRSMPDILPGLLSALHADVSRSIDTIRNAAAAGNTDVLARAAHGIAGAAGSVGGTRLAGMCRELELKGRSGSVEGAEALLISIEAEFGFLTAALEQISNEALTA
jgi:HPt (histidine-containing phosphotransfer) domain-containing protein